METEISNYLSQWSSSALSLPPPQNRIESFMGCFVILISNYHLRCEGVLYHLNLHDSTLGLQKVICYGTEGRGKNGLQILPCNKVYNYIVFRVTEIKDIIVNSNFTRPGYNCGYGCSGKGTLKFKEAQEATSTYYEASSVNEENTKPACNIMISRKPFDPIEKPCNPFGPIAKPRKLFSSLPKDIVLSILACISKSYYPTISLVSKSLRSIILSEVLYQARSHLGTLEDCVYLCFQPPTHPCDRKWFSLWIKPDDHQTLTYSTSKVNSTGNWLIPVPSSYSPRIPRLYETVGTEIYEIGDMGQNTCSTTDVWISSNLIAKQRKAPSMIVARKNPLTCSLDGKLYVMGGCEADESKYWAEVFDPKYQTWEPLPDPGADLRLSPIKKLSVGLGEVYVKTLKKNLVYLKSSWGVVEASFNQSVCEIDKVLYRYYQNKCWWYDTKSKVWRLVKGLSERSRVVTVTENKQLWWKNRNCLG